MATRGREPALRTRSSKLHQDLIDEAPAPVLPGFERGNDRMLRRTEMLGRVLVLRFVAASDVSARPAQAQMRPAVSHGEAFLAARRVRRIGHDEVEVLAVRRHGHPLYFSTTSA